MTKFNLFEESLELSVSNICSKGEVDFHFALIIMDYYFLCVALYGSGRAFLLCCKIEKAASCNFPSIVIFAVSVEFSFCS